MHIYSVLKLLTGLAKAAFIAWKLIVNKATRAADNAAAAKTHQLRLILYSKFFSHTCMPHHATGNASRDAINTSFKKSFDSMATIFPALAPNTFRTLISLIRC